MLVLGECTSVTALWRGAVRGSLPRSTGAEITVWHQIPADEPESHPPDLLKAPQLKGFRVYANTVAQTIISWYYPRPDGRSIITRWLCCDAPDFPVPAKSYRTELRPGHCGQIALF